MIVITSSFFVLDESGSSESEDFGFDISFVFWYFSVGIDFELCFW